MLIILYRPNEELSSGKGHPSYASESLMVTWWLLGQYLIMRCSRSKLSTYQLLKFTTVATARHIQNLNISTSSIGLECLFMFILKGFMHTDTHVCKMPILTCSAIVNLVITVYVQVHHAAIAYWIVLIIIQITYHNTRLAPRCHAFHLDNASNACSQYS